MSNLNNLYNAQDVILLCKIFENRFQAMFEKSGFNLRKCNSESAIQWLYSERTVKIILALPTNNLIMETFEKTLIGGFNCVNKRLSFNTELLMLNLTDTDYKKNKY